MVVCGCVLVGFWEMRGKKRGEKKERKKKRKKNLFMSNFKLNKSIPTLRFRFPLHPPLKNLSDTNKVVKHLFHEDITKPEVVLAVVDGGSGGGSGEFWI